MCSMMYSETDSESTSVDTFDLTNGASYAYVTKIDFLFISTAIISTILIHRIYLI